MEYSDNDPGVDNSFVECTESSTQLSDKEVELAEVSAADARSTELEGFNNEHLTRPLVSAAGLDSYGDVKPSQGADEMASLPLPQSQSALDPVIMEDLCPVCNDKVSGYHYGLQTCESCKGFFKRSVQNQKRYACVENQTCIIDKTQRKRCPYCRFQKCLSVGMKLEAVRPDRMRGGRNKFGPIYRRDRALRRQMRAQLQTDIDFQSVAQAAVSATLPRLDDSRPSYKYASVYGSNLDSVDEPVDVKPNLAELASYSSGYNRSTGVPRYSSVTAPATQPAVSSAQPATMSPANLHSQVPFGSFQPLNSAESKTSYSQDPLKGLTGMASAIVNQFIQQCDYSMTVSNSDSGHIQSVPIVQSAGQQAPSRQGSDASHNPYRLISTPGGSSYNQPPVYQNQIAEPARTFSECRRDLHYIDVSPGYPVAAMKGQKSTAAAERHLSPSRDDVSLYSSVESSLPMQRLNAPLTVAASVPEVTVSADTEGEASHRAAMTLQLISDLQRHSSNSRIPNGNSERLKRLAEELIQQTPTRTGPDGNATMDDAVRWAVALACRVCDQALFLLVEWARQAHFFRQLSIEDQMKLLESCWSELLLLDTLYKQLEHNDTQRVQMITGHYVTIDLLERIGLGSFCDQLQELIRRIRCLKLDANEYTCLRFIVLLNSDVPGLSDGARVEQFRAEVIAALLDYCSLLSLTNSGASSGGGSGSMEEEQASDKFGQMLLELSEIKMASQKIEQFVYQHYLNGTLNESDLLVEMLLSSRQ